MAVILVFEGIHKALAAEKLAQSMAKARSPDALASSLPELRPLPAAISSDCGFGLSFDDCDNLEDQLLRDAFEAGLVFQSAYKAFPKEGRYERIQ